MRLDAKTVSKLSLPAGKSDHITWDSETTRLWPPPARQQRRRPTLLDRTVSAWGDAPRTAWRCGTAERRAGTRGSKEESWPKLRSARIRRATRRPAEQRDAYTLRALIEEYLAFKEPSIRRPTYTNLAMYLRGPYFKPLHGTPVDAVTRRDVAARLVAITHAHGTIVAARARGALSTFYVWAMGNGLAEANPIIGTLKPQDAEPRSRVLSDEELAAIWRTCGKAAYGSVIKLLILTGARRGEVGGMRWSELDLDRGVWTIPPQRTKNKKSHVLPLMPMSLDIIAGVPRRATRDHLFGARSAVGLRHWHAKAVSTGSSGH